MMFKFQGFIKNVRYKTYLHNDNLIKTNINNFDINQAKAYGLIVDNDNIEIAYSQWVSPKRTRSYPFARIYNTYNNSKILTIIPIIKDEGKDGDRDKIQYATISWMNLANIYVILGFYEDAIKSSKKGQENKHKLTAQKFNNKFIKSQILQILEYKQSALHWNNNLISERFTEIFKLAVESYQKISTKTGVKIHETESLEKYLDKIKQDFNNFQEISQKDALYASERELMTIHKNKYLINGQKGILEIKNYLGGIYYLTVDEIYIENGIYIIQESKNSKTSKLPKITDIQDGLFKLILFSNLDNLKFNNIEIKFSVKLKLTGKNLKNSIHLTGKNDKLDEIKNFCTINKLSKSQKAIIDKLNLEVKNNHNLIIEISNNENND